MPSADGLSPRETLAKLAERIRELADRHARCFLDEVQPALADEGIRIVRWDELDDEETRRLADYFRVQGLPGSDAARGRPGAPFPLHLRALVEPRGAGPRPRRRSGSASPGSRCPTTCRASWSSRSRRSEAEFLPLEDLIAAHLSMLFPGMDGGRAPPVPGDPQRRLRSRRGPRRGPAAGAGAGAVRRRFGPAVRLEVADDIDDEVLSLLVSEIDVQPDDVLRVPGLLDLSCPVAGVRRRPPRR